MNPTTPPNTKMSAPPDRPQRSAVSGRKTRGHKLSPELRKILHTHAVPLETPIENLRTRARLQMESYLALLEKRLIRESCVDNHVCAREAVVYELLNRLTVKMCE